MKKHFTKLVFTFFVVALLSQFGTSQTYIWGGPGDKNSEFDGGLNDWTINAVSPNANAEWIWEADAKADRGAYFGTRGPIVSPSAGNGAMTFDSDFYDNDGIENNFKNGIAASPQVGELISPEFSCENQSSVWIQFNQYYRDYRDTRCLVAVSIDGGASWSNPYEVNTGVAVNGETAEDSQLRIDISSVAANQSTVKFKFIFDANYYFWVIDDVYVISEPPTDPQITGTWYPAYRFETPASCIYNDSMFFVMEVQNKGGKDAEGVKAKVSIINVDTETTLFADSTEFNLGTPDTAIVNFKSYMPPSDLAPGLYVAMYEISADGASTDIGKKYPQYFKISENNYVSSSGSDTTYSSVYSTNDDHPETYIKIGETKEEYNVNYFRTADWVQSNVVSVSATEVNMNLTIEQDEDTMKFTNFVYLLLLNDTIDSQLNNLSDEGLVVDGKDNDQITYVGYSSENLTDVVKRGSFTTALFDGEEEPSIILEPNSKYLLAAKWGTDKVYFQGFDTKYLGVDRYYFGSQLSYLIYTDTGFSVFRDTKGTWAMSLNIMLTINKSVATKDQLLPENSILFKGNPVQDVLNVSINLEKSISKASMAVTDINGRIIDIRNYNTNQKDYRFSTSNLPNGTYNFTLFTKDQLITKKFVVVK